MFQAFCRGCVGTGSLQVPSIAKQVAGMVQILRSANPEFFADSITALERNYGQLTEAVS